MRVLLSAVAALLIAAVPAAPAEAQSWGGQGFTANHGTQSVQWGGNRHDRHRHRGSQGDIVVGRWGYYDDWGRYNNRTFDPESFNDWWHERPWRSYPRWVTNGTCDRV